jgi:hypothetical protein
MKKKEEEEEEEKKEEEGRRSCRKEMEECQWPLKDKENWKSMSWQQSEIK